MTAVVLDATHDPARKSWLEAANAPATDFPLQNLPLGVFRTGTTAPRIGVAIGDRVLDLRAAVEVGVLAVRLPLAEACCAPRLNDLMRLDAGLRGDLRRAVHAHLADGSRLATDRTAKERVLRAAGEVELLLPAEVGDYTDFYASVDHATNVGSMFRPDQPLLYLIEDFEHLFYLVHDLEKRLDAGLLDNLSPGEPGVNATDLKSFLDAALAH